jgi:hypothetical protein
VERVQPMRLRWVGNRSRSMHWSGCSQCNQGRCSHRPQPASGNVGKNKVAVESKK